MTYSNPTVTYWNLNRIIWRSHGDSNPGIYRERVASGVLQVFEFVDKVEKVREFFSRSSFSEFSSLCLELPEFGISRPLMAINSNKSKTSLWRRPTHASRCGGWKSYVRSARHNSNLAKFSQFSLRGHGMILPFLKRGMLGLKTQDVTRNSFSLICKLGFVELYSLTGMMSSQNTNGAQLRDHVKLARAATGLHMISLSIEGPATWKVVG